MSSSTVFKTFTDPQTDKMVLQQLKDWCRDNGLQPIITLTDKKWEYGAYGNRYFDTYSLTIAFIFETEEQAVLFKLFND